MKSLCHVLVDCAVAILIEKLGLKSIQDNILKYHLST